MLEKINMPSMGATMEEGTIIAWRVKENDTVKAGDILLELETDKSTFEFESPCEGTVRKILAQSNQVVPVGDLIAVIGDVNEAIPADWLAQSDKPQAASVSVLPPSTVLWGQTQSADTGKIKISPKARKLAEKLGVDISKVSGSGPEGRIESSDIEKAASGASKAGPSTKSIPLDSVRKRINAAVTESKQQIPHFYLQTSIDMTDAVEYRTKLSAGGGKISYNAILFKAAVEGVKAEPAFNYEFHPDHYSPRDMINLGLAVETPKGVIIAVFDNIENKSIQAISQEMSAAVEKSRHGDMASLKQNGACLTISNLGMYRVETFIPIIHPGETAILGIGAIQDTPVVRDGQIVIRKMMPITLCLDHRIADGASAARFLEAFAKYLENLK